jgi:phosphoserine phosphatase RsbU/P
MPLGIDEEAEWTTAEATIQPKDMLLLYTDGATDAQDESGAFFGEDRLLQVASACRAESAAGAHASITAEIRAFISAAPQFDDITLVALARDP